VKFQEKNFLLKMIKSIYFLLFLISIINCLPILSIEDKLMEEKAPSIHNLLKDPGASLPSLSPTAYDNSTYNKNDNYNYH
jgi:hypothetical protein